MIPDHDVLIAGGGMAGLSAAVHLANAGSVHRGRTVSILEPRTEYHDDRTFSGFDLAPHPFRAQIAHRWSSFCIRANGPVQIATRTPYTTLFARAFYDEALRRIDDARRITLHQGARVRELVPTRDHVVVRTDGGDTTARVVLDARPWAPTPAPAGEIRLLQSFVGWFVRTDQPTFDPSTPTLMDFDLHVPAHAPDGARFMYVLPFAPDHALVECTFFAREIPRDDVFDASLHTYLEHAGAYAITHTERGVIPMSTESAAASGSPRIVPLGIRGGAAKPSTGYAFAFAQRHAANLAGALSRQEVPPPIAHRSRRSLALDRIFLSYLDRYPKDAPALFRAMFEKVPSGALVRFLGEQTRPGDALRVMSALPIRRFTTEAVRSTPLWLRTGRR